MDINEYKKPIQYLDTDLVTKPYQDTVVKSLYSDIEKYWNKMGVTIDEVERNIRKQCVEWTLTGDVKGKSPEYVRLIQNTMNDSNSSTLREQVTIDLLSDWSEIPGKHFYDSFKDDGRFGEVKPVNSGDLNGGGGITDFASHNNMDRLIKDRHLWEQNKLDMIVSGFVTGRIQYILEFPYSYKVWSEELIKYSFDRFEKVTKRQLKKTRTYGFTYNLYKECPDVKVRWINPNIDDYSERFSQPFLKYLKSINTSDNILKFAV
tara:strand:+ start:1920 stop:2705 length:786 start_codon:yes stop_codon:yes gene_type:complete